MDVSIVLWRLMLCVVKFLFVVKLMMVVLILLCEVLEISFRMCISFFLYVVLKV